MGTELTLPAPAKLNLFLHITGRREDGYHLLQTVFQFIDYSDELTFRLREDGVIKRLTDVEGVPEDDDLIVRAAKKLQVETGTTYGVDIAINKHLPMGGGLGGGSSDAATTLLGLNKLWNTQQSLDALADIGLSLGADVPVFVRGKACWAEGVGEVITPVSLSEPWFVVLVPDVSISTQKLFSNPALTRDCSVRKIRDLETGAGWDGLINVFEPLVRELYPEVDQAISFLGNYTDARLTGTGACVFGAFEKEDEARNAFAERPVGLAGFVAKGLNSSPVFAKL